MVSKILEMFAARYSVTEISKLLGLDYDYVDSVVCSELAKALSEVSGD